MLAGIYHMLCPACRSAQVFKVKNPYKLSSMGKMHAYCPLCTQSFCPEPGFYFGAAYVSYALMVALLTGFGILYYLFFGEIGDHMLRLLSLALLFSILISPFVFRYSRILYLYLMVRFKGLPAGITLDKDEN